LIYTSIGKKIGLLRAFECFKIHSDGLLKLKTSIFHLDINKFNKNTKNQFQINKIVMKINILWNLHTPIRNITFNMMISTNKEVTIFMLRKGIENSY